MAGRRAKTAAVLLAIAAIVYLIAGFLLAPALVRVELEDYARRDLGHQLKIQRVYFNPLTFNATIHGFDLREPDGGALLRFERLEVGLGFRTAIEGAWVISHVAVKRPSIYVEARRDDTLNYTRLLAALSADDTEDSPLPRLRVERIGLSEGELRFADLQSGKRARLDLTPITVDLQVLSTVPSESGAYELKARTAKGETLTWSGEGGLNPLHASGSIALANWKAATLAGFLGRLVRVDAPKGEISISGNYRFAYSDGSLTGRIDDVRLLLSDLVARAPGGEQALLTLGRLRFEDGGVDVGAQQIRFETSRVEGLRLDLRGSDGPGGWRAAIMPAMTGSAAQPAAVAAPEAEAPSATPNLPWRLSLPSLRVEGAVVAFSNEDTAAAIDGIDAGAALLAEHRSGAARVELRDLVLTTAGIRARQREQTLRLGSFQLGLQAAGIQVGAKSEAVLSGVTAQAAAAIADQPQGQATVETGFLEVDSATFASGLGGEGQEPPGGDSQIKGIRGALVGVGLRHSSDTLNAERIGLRAEDAIIGSNSGDTGAGIASLSDVALEASGVGATTAPATRLQFASATAGAKRVRIGTAGSFSGLQVDLTDLVTESANVSLRLERATLSAGSAALGKARKRPGSAGEAEAFEQLRVVELALKFTGMEGKGTGQAAGRVTLRTAVAGAKAFSLRRTAGDATTESGLGITAAGSGFSFESLEAINNFGILRVEKAALGLDRFESSVDGERKPGTDVLALQGLRLQASTLAARTADAKGNNVDLARVELTSNTSRIALGAGLEDLTLSGAGTRLVRATLRHPTTGKELATLGRAEVDGVSVGLARRQLSVERVVIAKGSVAAVIDAAGSLDWRALAAEFGVAPSGAVGQASAGSRGWQVGLKSTQVSGFAVNLTDQRRKPELSIGLLDVAGDASNLATTGNESGQVRLSANVRSGGRIQVAGQIHLGTPSADLKLGLSDISLMPAQAFLAEYAHLQIASALASAQGRLRYGMKRSTGADLLYEGSLTLSKILIEEVAPRRALIAADSVSAPALRLALGPDRMDIAEGSVVGLDTKILIDENQIINFSKVLKPRPPAETGPGTTRPFPVAITRVRVEKSRLGFSDLSLSPRFAVQVHDLNGVVAGASSNPEVRSRLQLDGRVEEFGLARIRGELKLLAPEAFADVAMTFRNLELTALTPYSAKFAGYRLASGKLSLDLNYKLQDKRLVGRNRIVLDKLALGEKVESPQAVDLPIELAIALLKDNQGRIDVSLPVTGDLADPKFDLGELIGKALGNLITGIVAAPFKMLAALFAGGTEEIDRIEFDPGSARLLAPEREKLRAVATALRNRPQLALKVKPGIAAAEDEAAIRLLALRREVYVGMGSELRAEEDPGPINFGQPGAQGAIERIYAERFGIEELRERQAAFARRTAPEAGTTSGGTADRARPDRLPMMYRNFFEHLLQATKVSDDVIARLGQARGQAIMRELLAGGDVAAARVSTVAPARVTDASANAVPTRLEVVVSQ